jgi:voltage-gated potassium channel
MEPESTPAGAGEGSRSYGGRRELLLANAFLLVLLLVGMIGYRIIEGWPLQDGLYMAFITLTTIGFAEVRELSTAGRIFTMAIGLSGIGAVAFIATRSAQLLLSADTFRYRQIKKMISKTSDHFILAGFGRIGSRIAEDLQRSETTFVVIETKSSKIPELENSGLLFIHGDAEQESVLQQAGIERARGLILTLPEDRANVFATLVARELNPDLFILVRTDTHLNRRKLIRAGADKVVSPYEIGADRMAQVILKPNVDRFMERVLQSGILNFTMDEVEVAAGSMIDGRTLKDADFRQRFDAIVVSIMKHESHDLSFNPGPDVKIDAGDTLIVMGSAEMIAKLKREGCSAE